MSNNPISLPSGMGGLMRYDAEYASRFMISPFAVIGFVVAILIFVLALKVLFPLQ